jgi:hypothetical protein
MMANKSAISSATLIAGLKPGEVFSRSIFLPTGRANKTRIARAKYRLTRILAPVIARVKKESSYNYSQHTTTAFTASYDVIVTASVLCEEMEDAI